MNDEDGKVSTVRYEAVNAMFLNEFLNEDGRLSERERELAKQRAVIAQEQEQIERLTTMVQKINDYLLQGKLLREQR